jgi:3-oxoacyl-(acyl-carrier-protein) synthase
MGILRLIREGTFRPQQRVSDGKATDRQGFVMGTGAFVLILTLGPNELASLGNLRGES